MQQIKTILLVDPVPPPSNRSMFIGLALMTVVAVGMGLRHGTWTGLLVPALVALWMLVSRSTYRKVMHTLLFILAQLLHLGVLLVLILFYFFVLTPVGIVRGWSGVDSLRLRFEKNAETYRQPSAVLRDKFEQQQF